MLPPTLTPEFSGSLDKDGGFLCLSIYWRPNPKESNPNMPGEKLSMMSYIPLLPREDCLCGSGKCYANCCQPKRYWHPVCPNPGMHGYSLVEPRSATFQKVDGANIRKQLMADTRFKCIDDSVVGGFWLLWGEEPFQNQYGTLCFGDLELKDNQTFFVVAMNHLRMQTLLDLLREIVGDYLSVPQIQHNETQVIDKWTGKSKSLRKRQRMKRSKRRMKRSRN